MIVLCLHCKKPIEKTDRAACGWQHVDTQMVICDPTDATPMTMGQQALWESRHALMDLLAR